MKRLGSAAWSGNLRDGKGTVSTESHALDGYPYTFFSRYGEKPGTNPEELLGAAHAACFESHARIPTRSRQSGLASGRRECRQEAGLGWSRGLHPHTTRKG